MDKETADPIDELLAPWLQANGDDESEQRLAQLLAVSLSPVITGVIRFKLRLGAGSADAPDADDLKQEALTEVLIELRKCRSHPDQSPIGDVRGLAATIAYRACYRWLRRQSPRRNALRLRLQYLLMRRPGLALWPDVKETLLSGLAAWRGRHDRASAAQLKQLADDESVRAQAIQSGARKGATGVSQLLTALFETLNLPIEFNALVGLTADLLQVKDEPARSIDDETSGVNASAVIASVGIERHGAGDDIAWQVEKRIFLQRLWEELQQLPRAQRAALLLNLRDASGRGCIALFPALGVASLRQLAAALEMPIEKFAALWNQLPLDDVTIARLLDLTRQQVINARKAGRERLARRLRGFF